MRTTTKIWLITAAFLVAVGLIMFTAVMKEYEWDFSRLNTEEFETNIYEINEGFGNISIDTDTADILFSESDDDTCKVICYEQKSIKHSVNVQEGTLIINAFDDREWYEHIGITIGAPKITICLPSTEYGSLRIKESTGDIEIPNAFDFKDIDISLSTGGVEVFASASESIRIKTSTGDIMVENISAKTLDLAVSTGNVTASGITIEDDVMLKASTGKTKVTGIRCKNLISRGSTGSLSLKDVIASEGFSIERSTGDVRLDGCDAAELFIKTDTGDIKGALLTDKVFITRTDTGSVDVPKTVTGGRCEIITDTGDIKISISHVAE